MPTTTATKTGYVPIVCPDTLPDGSPCPWHAEGPPHKETQILNMHRSRFHGYESTNPSTIRQREIRHGETEPAVIAPQVKEAAKLIADAIVDGTFKPGAPLGLAPTARWANERLGSEVSAHEVRTILFEFSRQRPPLVLKRMGVFYVAREGEIVARRGPGRPSGETLATRVADQIRDDLGIKYPVGSRLPSAENVGKAYGASSSTVQRAVAYLRTEQLVDEDWMVIALPPTAATAEPQPVPSPEPEPETKPEPPPAKRPSIRDHITGQIHDGTYPPGSLLPSLAKQAQVMNSTWQKIQYIYQELEKEGYIRRREDRGWEVLEWSQPTLLPTPAVQEARASVALDGETQTFEADEEGYLHPVAESDANSTASEAVEFITELIDTEKKLLAALRVSWGFEDETKALRKEVAELRTRPDDKATVNALRSQNARLETELRQANEANDRMRGVLAHMDDENAELRGLMHRRKNGDVAASFGPKFRNSVRDAVGMTPVEWERLQRSLPASPKERV